MIAGNKHKQKKEKERKIRRDQTQHAGRSELNANFPLSNFRKGCDGKDLFECILLICPATKFSFLYLRHKHCPGRSSQALQSRRTGLKYGKQLNYIYNFVIMTVATG